MAPVNLAARAHAITEGIFALPIERREEPYSATVAGLIRLALEEARDEALEEAATVCDAAANRNWSGSDTGTAPEKLAAAIRALKAEKPS